MKHCSKLTCYFELGAFIVGADVILALGEVNKFVA